METSGDDVAVLMSIAAADDDAVVDGGSVMMPCNWLVMDSTPMMIPSEDHCAEECCSWSSLQIFVVRAK